MSLKSLEKAVALAGRMGYLLVATADASGLPHVAAAVTIARRPDGRLEVTAWFCPGTVANLAANRRLSLVVWDPGGDRGYQILGDAEGVEDLAILDGYAPGLEAGEAMPQVEKRIIMRVERVLDFTRAPHLDREGE